MTGAQHDRPVVVAVADLDHVEQLVRTAGDLARTTDSGLRIVTVVVKPLSSPFSVYTDETIVERFSGDSKALLQAALDVAPDDVAIDRDVVVGQSVADGVLSAIGKADASALVIGWRERRNRTDAILGSNIDRLVEKAPCDLFIERIGYEADGVDSILLPVAGGPHVRPAAVAAKSIASENDATVQVLSVVASSEASEASDSAREYLETAVLTLAETPGPDVPVRTQLLHDDDVEAAIADAAADHDVVVFGATRQSSIRRRLVGSIPQRVIRRTDGTVILARSGAVVDRQEFGLVRRLWKGAQTSLMGPGRSS
ncbi:MAG: universal stress protein [Halobacteriota archaeon]